MLGNGKSRKGAATVSRCDVWSIDLHNTTTPSPSPLPQGNAYSSHPDPSHLPNTKTEASGSGKPQPTCYLSPGTSSSTTVKLDLQILSSLWKSAQNIKQLLRLKFEKLNKKSSNKNDTEQYFNTMTATVDILLAETASAQARIRAAASGICHMPSHLDKQTPPRRVAAADGRSELRKNSLSSLLDQQMRMSNEWLSSPALPAIGLGAVVPIQPVIPQMSVHLTKALLRITASLLQQEEKSATILYLLALTNMMKKSIDDVILSVKLMTDPLENRAKLASLIPDATRRSFSDMLSNPAFLKLRKTKMIEQVLNNGEIRTGIRRVGDSAEGCTTEAALHDCSCQELILEIMFVLPDPRSACLIALKNNILMSPVDYRTFKWLGMPSHATTLRAAGSFDGSPKQRDVAILTNPLLRIPKNERAFLISSNRVFFPDEDEVRAFHVTCISQQTKHVKSFTIDCRAIGILTIFPNCNYAGSGGRAVSGISQSESTFNNLSILSSREKSILNQFDSQAENLFYDNSSRLAPNNFILTEDDIKLIQHDISSAEDAEIFLIERIRALEEKSFWTFVIELILEVGGTIIVLIAGFSLVWCTVSFIIDCKKSRKVKKILDNLQLQVSDHANLQNELQKSMHSHASILGISPPCNLEHQHLAERLRADLGDTTDQGA